MLNKENNWLNPFGDGGAGARIVEILETMSEIIKLLKEGESETVEFKPSLSQTEIK